MSTHTHQRDLDKPENGLFEHIFAQTLIGAKCKQNFALKIGKTSNREIDIKWNYDY